MPPIYLRINSCHDEIKVIYISIGQRLKVLCSKDSDFISAVEEFSNYLEESGYNRTQAKEALLMFKIDSCTLLFNITRLRNRI